MEAKNFNIFSLCVDFNIEDCDVTVEKLRVLLKSHPYKRGEADDQNCERNKLIKFIYDFFYIRNNMSLEAIGSRLQCISAATLSTRFKMLDLAAYPCSHRQPGYEKDRKHKLKYPRIFKEVSDEDGAFWMGYLWGDGNIQDDGVRLRVMRSDYPILGAFAKYVGSDAPIAMDAEVELNSKKYYQASLCVYSVSMVCDLSRFGLVRNRSINNLAPIYLPPKFSCSFIRGLFEADGFIQHDGRPKDYFLSGWQCGICGAMSLMKFVEKFLIANEVNCKILRNGRSECNYRIVLFGPSALRFLCLLYETCCDETPAIARKLKLAKYLISYSMQSEELGVRTKLGKKGLRFVNTSAAKSLKTAFWFRIQELDIQFAKTVIRAIRQMSGGVPSSA